MRKFSIVFATLVIVLALISFSLALEPQLPPREEPKEVQVGLYLLNLGKFDIATGSFTADFYLDFQCEKECPEFDFEFMNGRASSIEKIIDEKDEKFYRIQANLNSPVNLRSFPFDRQEMQIIIEDKKATIDTLVYVPDIEESGIDNTIAFTGWRLGNWTAEERQHEYEVYDEVYSQYVFTIPINRIKVNSILKTFLPVIFILLVMLTGFFLGTDKILTRLTMAGSALVASVMFHISISNQIPPTGYLTFADKFMVLTYLIVLLTFGLNVIMLKLQDFKKKELVEKIHRYTEYSMFIIVAILYALLFIFGM